MFFAPPLLCAISWPVKNKFYKEKFPSASLIKIEKIRQWQSFLIFWYLLTYVAIDFVNLLELFRQGFVTSRHSAE